MRNADLIVPAADGSAPLVVSQAVIDAIDERPVGGASLTSGTIGGGSYQSARAAGAIHRVTTLSELKDRASGDAPGVVLVAEGVYASAADPRTVQVCTQPCSVNDVAAQQTLPSSNCTQGETVFDKTVSTDTLRVGSNKTIIGLDGGAQLVNVTVVLDGSSNVILRNLAIEQVDDGIATVGDGISLDPADHVWLDHLSLRDIAHASVKIASTWDEENAQALVDETGYVTLSNLHFDGFVSSNCNQRSEIVLSTNRNPAITVLGSWFEGSRIRAPSLLGPGTWMHLFNNLWSNIDGRGLELSCGAAGLLQGNVFQSAHNALYDSDSGAPAWQFCMTGYFGTLYAPIATGSADDNQLDTSSSMNLGGQTATGDGLALPNMDGADFVLTVPIASGTSTAMYRVTPAPDTSTVAADVQAHAGIGHLF